jgi:hypothetical protein
MRDASFCGDGTRGQHEIDGDGAAERNGDLGLDLALSALDSDRPLARAEVGELEPSALLDRDIAREPAGRRPRR